MARWWRDLISEEPIPEEIPYEEGDILGQIKAGKFEGKTEQQIMDYGRNLPGDWRDPNKLWITRAYEVSTPVSYVSSRTARTADEMAKLIGETRESLKPYAKTIGYLLVGKEGKKSLASYEKQWKENIYSSGEGYSGISFHKEEYEQKIKEGQVAEVPQEYF